MSDKEQIFDFTETEEELSHIKVIRPLEIGEERLPEGISALDFIEYEPVRSQKPFRYNPGEVPKHPLFGNLAVPSQDVVEIQFKPHSQFYREVFKDKYGKGYKVPEKREDADVIPWHLVREPENTTCYDRYESSEHDFLTGIDRNTVLDKIKSGDPLPLIRGYDKLMTTINWLNPQIIGSLTDEDSDEEK